MKKIVLLVGAAFFMASCANETKSRAAEDKKCLDFDVTSFTEVLEQENALDMYTDAEKAMISAYFVKYNIMHQEGDVSEFIKGKQKEFKAEGFKDHSNMCDILDDMRKQIEEKGMTEEEFLEQKENQKASE